MEITSPGTNWSRCMRRKIHPRPSSHHSFLSFFRLSRLASSRSSNSPGAMQPGIGDFATATREKKKVTVEKFVDSRGKQGCRDEERQRLNRREKEERKRGGREREGFVAGIYFSSSISQPGYRIRDGYLYVCKVIAPGWRTSASATCRVHLIAKVHPPSHPPSSLPIPLSRRLWR